MRREIRWIVAGAVLLLGVIGAVLYFQKGNSPVEQLALKVRRLTLVNQIRVSLASSAEAEKSAVLATTDEESQTFANQARANTAAAEAASRELEGLLLPGERERFSQFSQAFIELQHIDKEVLELAVKNTNLKASALVFGPATAAVKELDDLLKDSTAPAATVVRVGAWRLLASLPPHIAEENEAKMDAMEAEMTKEDRQIRRSLEEFANPSVAANYEMFSELRAQILKLSRENTNVRSLTLSLNQKRKALSLCQDAVAALQQAIQDEPAAGESSGKIIPSR